LDTQLEPRQRQYAESIRSSAEALLALLNDVLDISKIEAGRIELEVLDFDLRKLLEEFAAPLAVRAQDKGLEFVCAAEPNVPSHVCGDASRIRQILTNLAGNAVKFTHAGEVSVTARLVAESATDVQVRFVVRDTGIGIPADKQAKLFQKFTQVDASTTRRYGGSGLGLAIAKELTELMGGQIGFASEEGRGAEFWFTLRLGKSRALATPDEPLSALRGARVLIVDDNATNRELLLELLGAWGMRAELAADGVDAFARLQRAADEGDPFRAAVIDQQMPDVDGQELARRIRKSEPLRATPLILLSSLGHRGDFAIDGQVGWVACLTKPVRQAELQACLTAVLAAGGDLSRANLLGDLANSSEPTSQGRAKANLLPLPATGARVLVVEDNIVNQEVALGMLRDLGLRADAVGDGREALEALRTLPYDLVLMDMRMPELDGPDAARRIRAADSVALNPNIPIIAMTANALPSDRQRCLASGM
ncbi:MAG TPA: response regulator, partial [Pirellulaceae bacterium]|nr:response regulator [Pirellulaceae bacterium]